MKNSQLKRSMQLELVIAVVRAYVLFKLASQGLWNYAIPVALFMLHSFVLHKKGIRFIKIHREEFKKEKKDKHHHRDYDHPPHHHHGHSHDEEQPKMTTAQDSK